MVLTSCALYRAVVYPVYSSSGDTLVLAKSAWFRPNVDVRVHALPERHVGTWVSPYCTAITHGCRFVCLLSSRPLAPTL